MIFDQSNDLSSKGADREQAVRDFAVSDSTKKTLTKMAELVTSFEMGGFKMGCIINGVTYHITFEKDSSSEDSE